MPSLAANLERVTRHVLSRSGGVSARLRRRIAFALLVVFAAGQASALVHMGGATHDHDAPCAACRVAGDHATAVLPAAPVEGGVAMFESLAPWAPKHARPQVSPRRHPPRAPPFA
jgi:hypothetical protein